MALSIQGCGSSAPSDPDCAKPEFFCVGLVTDYLGKVNDKAFNQLAWEGLKQARDELAAHVEYIQTVEINDYDKNIDTFAQAHYDVIVTVGYSLKQATTDAALRYPDIAFIGVDQTQDLDKSLPQNLTGLTFPEDQAGFLAGALAAQMTKSKKIGAVCGPEWFPPAALYGQGFKAGAAYIDPDVAVTIDYHNDIAFNASIIDPEWDAATATALVGQGVDVIFGSDGDQQNGAVAAVAVAAAAATDAKQAVYAIGVNTDQYLTLPKARKVLLSSTIKLVSQGVFDLIKAAQAENFPGGNFIGQVGYAPFHDLDRQVPDSVKRKMSRIQAGLTDGSIQPEIATPTPEITVTPTARLTSTATPTRIATSTQPITQTPLITPTPSHAATQSTSSTVTPTPSIMPIPSRTPTQSILPTPTPTRSAARTPTGTPTT